MLFFEYFPKISSEMNFLAYFDTQNVICEEKKYSQGSRGSQISTKFNATTHIKGEVIIFKF